MTAISDIDSDIDDVSKLVENYQSRTFRRLILLLAAIALLAFTVVADIVTGPASLSFADVMSVIFNPSDASVQNKVIVWDLRLPIAPMAVFVGAVAFVGLVGPHIARIIVGEDQRGFLPFSALAGALIMSGTSIASKAITPGVIYPIGPIGPIGMITSLIGILFFISLILTQRQRHWQ